jgi:hypothetical protein
MDESAEDNARLIALQSSEQVRMGACQSAVPKLEGAVTLLEQSGNHGRRGMEFWQQPRSVGSTQLGQPLSTSRACCGQTGNSKAVGAGIECHMYTLRCSTNWSKYERAAFEDRRTALVRHKDVVNRCASYAA